MAARVPTWWLVTLAVVAAPPARAYEAVPVTDGGALRGTVSVVGPVPVLPPLPVTKDRQACGTEVPNEDIVVGPTGGLADAVVWIAAIGRGKPFEAAAPVLEQRGCRYVPRVLLVPAGETVTVTNGDGILHNIHTYGVKNPPLNRAHPHFRPTITHRFEEPEIIPVKCDAHRWMRAWIVVEAHPYYAKTEAAGTYVLGSVPAGAYELRVWHPTLGERAARVVVRAGESTATDFELAVEGGHAGPLPADRFSGIHDGSIRRAAPRLHGRPAAVSTFDPHPHNGDSLDGSPAGFTMGVARGGRVTPRRSSSVIQSFQRESHREGGAGRPAA